MKPVLKKNDINGNTELVFGDKLLQYNSSFKVYLFTNNASGNYSINLISKVTTVNFAITQKQLEEELISIILSIQYP